MTASEAFAAHALELRWAGLPAVVQERTCSFLLDTVAVGIAGAKAPQADAVVRTFAGEGFGAGCVLGRAERLAPRAAAASNAFQIHAQEFDCVHQPAVLHPLSATLGAMIAACAQTGPVDGATFGAALVAGVDVAVALGLAGTGALSFFRPATAGIFGATVAVARLRGLTQAQIVAALGHALCFCAGTMQAHVEGTPGLALQVANAAGDALLAVELALQGVSGAKVAIEGPYGYLALFERGHDLAPVLGALGGSHRIAELSHKPYPTGRAAHGVLGALQAMLRTSTQVVAVRTIAPGLIARLVGRPAMPGMTVNYARLCLPFLAATMALRGRVDLESFSPAGLADPAVLALAERITVQADDTEDPAAFVPALVEVETADGGVMHHAVTALPGSPAWPLAPAARLDKIRHCLAYGGVAIGADDLAGRIGAFATCPDMGRLFAGLCG